MSDYITFEGQVVPIEWGDATYTILPLPAEVAAALERQNAKRVVGEINDHPVNLALTKAPVVDGTFLWAGKSLLDACGIEPGEIIEVRLKKTDPDAVDVDADIIDALRAAQVSDLWSALTPGKQRGHLHMINTAKRADTRQKRINKLIAELRT